MAYKILYHVFCDMESETLRILKHLTPEEKLEEPIKHALDVRKALETSNYGRFFKLYRMAPKHGPYLMEIFLSRHRILCLLRLATAYRATNVDVGYLSNLLAFNST